MGKLNSILARTSIIKKISEDLKIPEDIIDRVVTDQFKQVNKAFMLHDEIEVSGFGKFLQSQNKIKRRRDKCEIALGRLGEKIKAASTQEEVIRLTEAMEGVSTKLSFYNSKLKPKDEAKGYSFGMAESSVSPGKIEGRDTESEQREIGDMQELPPQLYK